jgi:hypothetical protein
MAAPADSRLLTPGQIRLAVQLAKIGIERPAEVATMLGVPEERLRRSFRIDRPQPRLVDPVAYLQQIGQVPLTPIPEDED